MLLYIIVCYRILKMANTILGAFNNHFLEFLDDVLNVFPENRDIQKARISLQTLCRMNPQLLITIWKTQINTKYQNQIMSNDINFFLSKDYQTDINDNTINNASTILSIIERMRAPIMEMSESNKQKSMKYLQNLTKLANMY